MGLSCAAVVAALPDRSVMLVSSTLSSPSRLSTADIAMVSSCLTSRAPSVLQQQRNVRGDEMLFAFPTFAGG